MPARHTQTHPKVTFAEYRRTLCNTFLFWGACSSPQCRRQRACAGDPLDCFSRGWRYVPEGHKVWLRTWAKARLAGMPHEEACRVAAEDVARSGDYIAEVDARTDACLRAENAAREGK